LIVSQYGHSSRRPHRTCPRSPRGPPRAPLAPRALGELTPEGALPGAASLQPEPDSPLATHLSRVAWSRGGGLSPEQQPTHPECAAVRCGGHRGH
jgi:hypothetical protein